MTQRYVSLFSGAGGLDLGLIRAGFKPGLMIDHGRAAATLRAAMPTSAVMQADIHDLLNAGTIAKLSAVAPPVLVAGKPPLLHGAMTEKQVDPDSDYPQLLYRFMDAVNQAAPAAFVLAAIPALGGGRWTGVMHRLRHTARSLGYDTFTPVFDAADYGVPQRRNVLFLVGLPKGCKFDTGACPKRDDRLACGPVLRALPGGRDIPCPSGVTLNPRPAVRNSPYSGQLLNGSGRMLDLRKPAAAIAADLGGNKTPVLDVTQLEFNADPWIERYHDYLWRLGGTPGIYDGMLGKMRRLTLRECAALQGFPPDYPFTGPTVAQYRQVGGAVPPALGQAVGHAVLAALA